MGKSWSMKHMSDSLPWWTSSFERGCVFSISTARVNSKEILTEGSVTQRHCSTCFDHSKNLEVVEWPLVGDISIIHQPSLVSQLVKNLPAMQETPLLFLGWDSPLRSGKLSTSVLLGFPGGPHGKESTCNEGDLGLIPGLGRAPVEGNGDPLQYSCLENPHE